MNRKSLTAFVPGIILLLALFILVSLLSAQSTPPLRSPNLIPALYDGDPTTRYLPLQPSTSESVLTPDMLSLTPPSWTSIAYESYANYNWDVYTMKPDGSNVRRLTSGSAVDAGPSLNRGASQVLFNSNRSGNYDIYKANADGTNVQQMTNHSANDTLPMWSPDGSRIAFQSNRYGSTDIFVMNANGSNLRRLTTTGAYNGAPNWSPDGSQIVFSSNRNGAYQIWVMDADGSNQRLLNALNPAFYPAWSPYDNHIAFAHDSNQDGFLEIWVMDADGANARIFANTGNQSDKWFPTWSPDGKYLAVTSTSWTNYQGQWYWTESYIYVYEYQTGYFYWLSGDDRAWRSHWGSADATPPESCTISAPVQSRWATVGLQFGAGDIGAGVSSYEIQKRNPGGEWEEISDQEVNTATNYQAQRFETVQFRCRATDWAGNTRAWTDAPVVTTTVDAAWPQSTASVTRWVRGNQALVSWSGSDEGTGVVGYDVYVKEGNRNNWTLWQNDTVNTSAVFTGTIGKTYYFRSQATDGVGHVEAWQPVPQTAVTLYTHVISGTVTDNRGFPLFAAPVLTPTSSYDSSLGLYQTYTSDALTHTLSLSASGYEVFPPTDLGTASDARFDAVLGPGTNLVANGGFENGDLSGWIDVGNGPSVANSPYSGKYGLQIQGCGSGATAVFQSIFVPDTQNQPTLSFLYQLPSDLISGTLQVKVSGILTTAVLNTAVAAPNWTHVWADLSPFAGQTITLSASLDAITGTAVLDAFTIGPWETPFIYSVSPAEVQPGEMITITGDNLIDTPALFINDMEITAVHWISPTQMTAVLSDTIEVGVYTVRVINPGGPAVSMTDTISVTKPTIMLPIILNDSSGSAGSASESMPDGANWLTLGYDAAHTGYHQTDVGGSYYKLIWTATVSTAAASPRPLEQIAVADGVLVAASDSIWQDSAIIALNAYTGQELWRFPVTGKYSLNPPTIANGFVYFQQANRDGDTYLFSLNLYTGVKQWQSPFSAQAVIYLAPIVAGDMVYFNGGMYGGLYAFNAVNGQRNWFVNLPQYAKWAPAFANDKLYSWVKGIFYEHDPETGEVLWSLNVGWNWNGYDLDTAPVIEQNMALTASWIKLAAINLDTQSIAWSVAGDYDQTIPAVADGVVYAIRDGQLEARRLVDGDLLWTFAGDNTLTNAPVVAGDYVYVASNNNTYVINRHSQEVVWTTAQGGWLSVANGFLYIAQPDKTIYAYRAQLD